MASEVMASGRSGGGGSNSSGACWQPHASCICRFAGSDISVAQIAARALICSYRAAGSAAVTRSEGGGRSLAGICPNGHGRRPVSARGPGLPAEDVN